MVAIHMRKRDWVVSVLADIYVLAVDKIAMRIEHIGTI
jgi:hypothetical protein